MIRSKAWASLSRRSATSSAVAGGRSARLAGGARLDAQAPVDEPQGGLEGVGGGAGEDLAVEDDLGVARRDD